MTYLITFACYGSHLHGNEIHSVDRNHNRYGGPSVEAAPQRVSYEKMKMTQPPYEMDRLRRDVVLASMIERCAERDWKLLAAHVRSSHVHVVVESEVRP